MNPQEMKRLQTTRKQLVGEMSAIVEQAGQLAVRRLDVRTKLDKINAELKRAEQGPPTISEHAILRYLERKYELDIEEVKKEMVTDKTLALVSQLGDGKYPIDGGGKLVIKNNVAVSVIA